MKGGRQVPRVDGQMESPSPSPSDESSDVTEGGSVDANTSEATAHPARKHRYPEVYDPSDDRIRKCTRLGSEAAGPSAAPEEDSSEELSRDIKTLDDEVKFLRKRTLAAKKSYKLAVEDKKSVEDITELKNILQHFNEDFNEKKQKQKRTITLHTRL